MKDNDIIKAAEWCFGGTSDNCRNCPLEYTAFCEDVLQDNILDLINRQQAEIERLKKRNIKNCRNWQSKYYLLRDKAIKEFAKAMIDKIDGGLISHSSDIVDFTADYLKNRVGEENV